MKKCLLASFAFFLVSAVMSPAFAERMKIGLVLGGGGAAGVAHVGVIRELERLGIRPDVVTGTSMGAIIGGLYAAGYTPDDLERVALEVEWDSILNDASDRRLEQPLLRDSRLEPLSVQADLPIGIGSDGVQLDSGLVDGVKLTAILSQLTVHVNEVDSFDNLPIPFRAVATDLTTGLPVILDRGPLVNALRASMSIPALFPPVEIDGRLLVDGGVANNLPVDVARQMGADVVIVSSIPAAERSATELRSFGATLSQTMSLFIQAGTRAQLESLGPQDVLFVPDVGSVGMLDFADAPNTIVEGQSAVVAQESRILALAKSRDALVERNDLGDLRSQPLPYDRIEVDYSGVLDPEIIKRRLGLPDRGSVTGVQLEAAIARVYGLNLFESVVYEYQTRDTERVLVVRATPRDDGLLRPRLGLQLNDKLGGDGDFTLALGASLDEVNSLGGQLDLDAAIGRVDAFQARFSQPLNLDQLFHLRGTTRYVSRHGTLFGSLDDPRSQINVERAALLTEFLWTPGDWGRIGTGIGYQHQTVDIASGFIPGTQVDEVTEDQFPVALFFDYDTLDDPDLPRTGAQISMAYRYDLNEDESPSSIELDGVVARSIDQHTFSTFLRTSGDLDPQGFEPRFVGGFQNLSGLSNGELLGNVTAVVGARYYKRFGFEHPFGDEAFTGFSLEYGGAFDDWSNVGSDGSFVAGSIFAGAQSPLGPIVLGLGAAEQGQYESTFNLGYRF
jgi:NTE family protein